MYYANILGSFISTLKKHSIVPLLYR